MIDLERVGRAMPDPAMNEALKTMNFFGAMDNFTRMFDIAPDDNVVMLVDPGMDPRVVHAIDGFSRARGSKPTTIVWPTTQLTRLPDEVKPIVDAASFVVASWFCAVADPYCQALRRDKGQKWVKLTYFRDFEVINTPQARFPIELVGEIVRATAARYRRGDGDVVITDPRGGHFVYNATKQWTELLLDTNRWRGELLADKPGCYVHYLATHGPNIYERTALKIDRNTTNMPINGTVYPQWAVGFPKPFSEKIGVRFADDLIVEITGESQEAADLREMLIGARLIELGCGFNPKAPRAMIYPAGSNSPGALHFGVEYATPSRYLRRVLPNWEEPPVHMDLVTFDSTVMAGSVPLITDGFLEALRDVSVVKMAENFGDPIDLLEGWPD